jgi:hypothetical protein
LNELNAAERLQRFNADAIGALDCGLELSDGSTKHGSRLLRRPGQRFFAKHVQSRIQGIQGGELTICRRVAIFHDVAESDERSSQAMASLPGSIHLFPQLDVERSRASAI